MLEHFQLWGQIGAAAGSLVAVVIIAVMGVNQRNKIDKTLKRFDAVGAIDRLTASVQEVKDSVGIVQTAQVLLGDLLKQIDVKVELDSLAVSELKALTRLSLDLPTGVAFPQRMALFVTGKDGSNRWTNQAYAEFFGISGLQNDWYQVVDACKSPSYIKSFLHALKAESSVTRFNQRRVYLFVVPEEGGAPVSTACDIRCSILRDRKHNQVHSAVGVAYESDGAMGVFVQEEVVNGTSNHA